MCVGENFLDKIPKVHATKQNKANRIISISEATAQQRKWFIEWINTQQIGSYIYKPFLQQKIDILNILAT